jgi:hypothetical protein
MFTRLVDLVDTITHLHHTARAAGIVLWGVAVCFVLTPTNVLAKKASRQAQGC